MSSLATLKSRRALAVRHHGPDSPQAREAAAKLAAERTTIYIESLVAAAPPLSTDQKARLAELLKPARDAITQARLAELADVDGRKAKAAARKAARQARARRQARRAEQLGGGAA